MTYPYLTDPAFLAEVDAVNIKEQFVKITILDWAENPIADIQGRVSGGSINLNGTSAVRRTGNITFVCDDDTYDILQLNNLISINKKIQIEIGYANTFGVYEDYDIIWFPQGTFVIINPSITHNGSGLSVSIQFKDKMCLLNGECGGVLPATIAFHETEEEDGTIQRNTYKDIIYTVVNAYGGEPAHKIIIKDVPDCIKKVMKYVGSEAIEVPTYTEGAQATQTLDIKANEYQWLGMDEGLYTVQIETDSKDYYLSSTAGDSLPYDKERGYIIRYPLLMNLYDNNLLDEYLCAIRIDNYDTEVSSFLIRYTYWNKNEEDTVTFAPESDVGYIYERFCPASDLIGQAGQNAVTILEEIKKQLGNFEYFYDLDGNFVFQEVKDYLNVSKSTSEYESIKQTPEGYLFTPSSNEASYAFTDSSLITSYQNTPSYANIKNDYIVWGTREGAGGAKRAIYYHVAIDYKPATGNRYYIETDADGKIISAYNTPPTGNSYKTLLTQSYLTELFIQGKVAETADLAVPNRYYKELRDEWEEMYTLQEQGAYWIDVPLAPDFSDLNLEYFLDLIEPTSQIGEFSIDAIGVRSKTWSDNKVNCIFAKEPPEVIIPNLDGKTWDQDTIDVLKDGAKVCYVDPSVYKQLAGGGYQNSAFSAIRDILYQYTNYNESITISALPIYYLEPNTRITVEDEKSSIHGDYIIKTVSRPFDCNGTMNITATKALTRF